MIFDYHVHTCVDRRPVYHVHTCVDRRPESQGIPELASVTVWEHNPNLCDSRSYWFAALERISLTGSPEDLVVLLEDDVGLPSWFESAVVREPWMEDPRAGMLWATVPDGTYANGMGLWEAGSYVLRTAPLHWSGCVVLKRSRLRTILAAVEAQAPCTTSTNSDVILSEAALFLDMHIHLPSIRRSLAYDLEKPSVFGHAHGPQSQYWDPRRPNYRGKDPLLRIRDLPEEHQNVPGHRIHLAPGERFSGYFRFSGQELTTHIARSPSSRAWSDDGLEKIVVLRHPDDPEASRFLRKGYRAFYAHPKADARNEADARNAALSAAMLSSGNIIQTTNVRLGDYGSTVTRRQINTLLTDLSAPLPLVPLVEFKK